MIASGRSPRLNAAHRRRLPSREGEGAPPTANSSYQITHCAGANLNDRPAALLYCNRTTRTLPEDRTALTAAGQASILPHR
jgi:hypothetical protein